MVKDLQIVQVLACDLILRVGNVCVFFACCYVSGNGLPWLLILRGGVICVNVMKYKFYNMLWNC